MALNAIIARIRHLLLAPATEWEAIAGEPANIGRLYATYVAPLVVVSALAGAIGKVVFGVNIPFVGTFHVPPGALFGQAAVAILLGLIAVYALALVINALAPQFGAAPDMGQAFKLAAYAPTAHWVANLLNIIPKLDFVVMLCSLYVLYLFFVGIPKLMKPGQDKAMPYTIAVCVVAIGIWFVIGLVTGSMMPAMTPIMRVN